MPIRPSPAPAAQRLRRLLPILLLALALPSCAGRAWRAALSEDTAAAYYRYLREYPGSSYAKDARARLAFVRVRRRPSPAAFERFAKDFPGSPLIEELRPFVENAFFESAREQGTAQAYRRFLAEFPRGDQAERAEGNAVYLEAGGFGGDPARLAAFAKQHPKSDFAAEAERSVASLSQRGRSRFERVGLVLDIPADVPSADRLKRLFAARAAETYRRAHVPLIPMTGTTDPRLAQVGARLTISHREHEASPEVVHGQMTQKGVLAETTVTLSERGQEEPIWNETFTFRVPLAERVAGESILLHPRAWTEFWGQTFFTPVARWNTRIAVRAPRRLDQPAVAVETAGSRAVVLFGDGDFQMLDLGDPESPALLAEYHRPRDLLQFEGVEMLPYGVAIFGPDGIEIVGLDGGPHREHAFSRDVVGSIVGLVAMGDQLVAAGNRGLLLIGPDGKVQTIYPREALGLARHGDQLLFTDGSSLFIGSLAVLRRGRVESELQLGRGFRPARVRVSGDSAVVLGDPGLVWVDVSHPSRPRIVSRIDSEEAGEIQDASVVGGRVFLLGTRGLQVSDPSGELLVDSVDVTARHRLDVEDRHVVLVGEKQLQVVDATAFTASGAAAPATR